MQGWQNNEAFIRECRELTGSCSSNRKNVAEVLRGNEAVRQEWRIVPYSVKYLI
jgi:hypothetical protein